MAAGRSSTRLIFWAPSADPPEAGFTISGRPSRATIRPRTAPAPSSRKVLCGSAPPAGRVAPAGPEARLAPRLVPREPAGRGRGPHVRHTGEVQDGAQGAVLARGAVQGDEDGVGRCGREAWPE